VPSSVRWMPMVAIAFLLVPACAGQPVRAPTADGAPEGSPSGVPVDGIFTATHGATGAGAAGEEAGDGTEPGASAEPGRPPASAVALDGGGNVTARLDRPVPLGASKGLTVELEDAALGAGPGAPLDRTLVWDASLETSG
jgi:hypothetical protein